MILWYICGLHIHSLCSWWSGLLCLKIPQLFASLWVFLLPHTINYEICINTQICHLSFLQVADYSQDLNFNEMTKHQKILFLVSNYTSIYLNCANVFIKDTQNKVLPHEHIDKNLYITVHLYMELFKCMWNQDCYLCIGCISFPLLRQWVNRTKPEMLSSIWRTWLLRGPRISCICYLFHVSTSYIMKFSGVTVLQIW